jgi:hypothetical protein
MSEVILKGYAISLLFMDNKIAEFRDLLMNHKSKSMPRPKDYAASNNNYNNGKLNTIAQFRKLLIRV